MRKCIILLMLIFGQVSINFITTPPAYAVTLTIIMYAPQPNATFSVPSGNVYVSGSTNLIVNVQQQDVQGLQAFGCIILTPRNNVSATQAPTNTDDFTAGYGVGSQWVNVATTAPTVYILTAMTSSVGSATWTQVLASSTSGTVNSGTQYAVAYYPSTGTIIGPVGPTANGILFTDSSKVPHLGSGIPGNVFFGSGQPWVDVKSGTNGCAAALGDGSTNDYAAINCQVQFMNTTYNGGFVYFPPGIYELAGNTLTVPGHVILKGAGRDLVSSIQNVTDATVIYFPCGAGQSGCATPTYGEGGMRDLDILGFQGSSSATQDAVIIDKNNPVFIRDCRILGGHFAIDNLGNDGSIEDVYASGWTGALRSSGANWYIRDKFDGPIGPGVATTYGYLQDPPYAGYPGGGIVENHFTQVDFSGSYTASIAINDTTNKTVTTIASSVMSSPISISSGTAMFVGDEFGGGTSFAGDTTSSINIIGGYVVGGTITISTTGVLKCSAGSTIGITNC